MIGRIGTGILAVALSMAAGTCGPVDAIPRPLHKVPFPPIKKWSSLTIRLERTMCFGTCPVYSVEIAGDGAVTYVGKQFVAQKGTRTARIAPEKVKQLYRQFAAAEFFWTFDSYRGPVTDMPSHILTISFDGRRKTVVDYAGTMAAMPKAINDLETAVDAAAGTNAWIGTTRTP